MLQHNLICDVNYFDKFNMMAIEEDKETDLSSLW